MTVEQAMKAGLVNFLNDYSLYCAHDSSREQPKTPARVAELHKNEWHLAGAIFVAVDGEMPQLPITFNARRLFLDGFGKLLGHVLTWSDEAHDLAWRESRTDVTLVDQGLFHEMRNAGDEA